MILLWLVLALNAQPVLPRGSTVIAGREPSPNAIFSVVAMTVSPDGTIWVGDGYNLYRVEPGGTRSRIPGQWGTESGLAAHASGSVFAIDRSGAVVERSPDGTVFQLATRAFGNLTVNAQGEVFYFMGGEGELWKVSRGRPAEFVTNHLPGPGSLAADSSGAVYAAVYGHLYRVERSGAVIVMPGFAGATGVALTLQGDLLVAGNFQRSDFPGVRILKRDRASSIVAPTTSWVAGNGLEGDTDGCTTPGRSDAKAARVSQARVLSTDASGNIYFVAGPNRVRMISPAGTISTRVGIFGSDTDLSNPQSVRVRPDGSVIFADTGNHRIRRIRTGGAVETLAGGGAYAGQDPACFPPSDDHLSQPEGVAPGINGELWIADTGNSRIVTAAEGRPTVALRTPLPPRKIVVDPDGTVYFSAGMTEPFVVFRWDRVNAPQPLDLVTRRLLAIDSAGSLYATPLFTTKLQADGKRVGLFATRSLDRDSSESLLALTDVGLLRLAPDCTAEVLVETHLTFSDLALESDRSMVLTETVPPRVWRIPVPSQGRKYPLQSLPDVSVMSAAIRRGRDTGLFQTFRFGGWTFRRPIILNEILAPGQQIVIQGSCIGPLTPLTGADALAVIDLRVNGVPAPVLSAQADEVVAVVPYEINPPAQHELTMEYRGIRLKQCCLETADTSPGIFPLPAGTLLRRGEEFTFYATGEGQTDPPSVTGEPAKGPPVAPVSVTVKEAAAEVLYAGPEPTLLGVLRVTIRVPLVAPGSAPLTLRVGERSHTITVAVTLLP